MKKKSKEKGSRATTFLEYAILISVVVAALSVMFNYLQKSVNTSLKNIQSEISNDLEWENE